MLSINPWNILWTVVNLLVIYAIFRKFLFQPVMNVINAREKMINDQFESAKNAEDEAAKLKEEYHDKIKTAKTEADKILADAKERADEAYNSQMEDIRVETERLKEKAKRDIEAQHEKAMQATQAEIAKLAVVAARKILETGDSRDADSSK
ncbi:MAG: F0F1 ATP synthase subunit B [Clostridium sp.]|uniref:F0F1 ATP synthase subunit B n=1 Tax=Butyribacter sp. TaxID=2822465 RepID=UPI002A988010|nr:F0F1 ATP synthase subunit B [Clostridium sp.]MDY5181807.1 F0F1 ATP synthase subunit B [Butyribacter sp.]